MFSTNPSARERETAEVFESVAMVHLDDLYRTALRVTGSRPEADDAVQETFFQAWKSFHRFELGTNCRAWLYKILFHVMSHRRRHWLRWNAKYVESEERGLEETLVYEPPIPETLRDEDVLAALERLSRPHREIVLLVDVEEFSYKETAEVLGVPIGTVMSRLARARAALRSELAGFAKARGIAAN